MTNDDQSHLRLVIDDDDDRDLTNSLRALYAAPDTDGYWTALEQRIMDRIARGAATDTFWYVPTQWTRVGLIAAGFALIVAASLFLRQRAEERQMAYDSVLGQPTGGPTLAIRDVQSERQATITYINGR